jgi:hypothetical protein
LKSKMSLSPSSPQILESLNQSQTIKIDSGGSLEVKIAIISIGTKLS